VVLRVRGGSPIHVVHAPATVRRALIYLHGVCGDILAIRSWAEAASAFGTLVALFGDAPCRRHPGRFSWQAPVEQMQKRIDRALEVVADARGGLLDRQHLTVIGYSQGASRAELLVQRFPERYPYVVLGGDPTEPSPERLHTARAVAVIGGELDSTRHMQAGAEALLESQMRARFMILPQARHGQYGPEASRVMGEALRWLFEEPSESNRQ
jgi:predicted esterase